MKNLVLTFIIGFSISACAHHDTNVEHHHHEEVQQASFEGRCAYSVAHNDLEVKGKKEFSFEHAGMTYYFSSEEKMNLFKKDLDKSVEMANKHWMRH